jgi:hypothetical protein
MVYPRPCPRLTNYIAIEALKSHLHDTITPPLCVFKCPRRLPGATLLEAVPGSRFQVPGSRFQMKRVLVFRLNLTLNHLKLKTVSEKY